MPGEPASPRRLTDPSGPGLYLGIDVGINRGCAFAWLDDAGELRGSGWFDGHPPAALIALLREHAGPSAAVAIDAPRRPVPVPRAWFWDGARARWRPRCSERGSGRHCEVVVKALGLGNPQWTPLASDPVPPWMELGFRLFATFAACGVPVHEAFPTASYAVWDQVPAPRIRLTFDGFRRGPKDLLDACAAAATAREFAHGRGWEAGGGDGLGSILLPARPVRLIPEVLEWPGDKVDLV